jgi:hypothetical protein
VRRSDVDGGGGGGGVSGGGGVVVMGVGLVEGTIARRVRDECQPMVQCSGVWSE